MRTLLATLLLAGFLSAVVGCQNGQNPFQSKGKTQPAAQAPAKQTEEPAPAENEPAEPAKLPGPPMPTAAKPDFQGQHLTVRLDGQTTAPAEDSEIEQIWIVNEPISPAPTLQFTLDEAALGPVKKASIIINPIVDGEVRQADLWQYAGRTALAPGQPIALDVFHHIAEGGIEQNLQALPPGEYRISIQVNGEQTWDRQHIRATVK